MYCHRLDHFRRLMPNGNVGLCGHMVNGPSFENLEQLEASPKLKELRHTMDVLNEWPEECQRCKLSEAIGQKSIRQNALDRHTVLQSIRSDYLIVGGILDNICNAACQFCTPELSTKIGNLHHGKDYVLTNNTSKFTKFPQDRIIELDINGGEPSNSPNYRYLLRNPPPNVKIIRINTNGSGFIDLVPSLISKGIKVIITLSLDGIGDQYEYIRYPLKWEKFTSVVDQYARLRDQTNLLSLDFWTTLSVYTLPFLPNIRKYADSVEIDMSLGILSQPSVLSINRNNYITRYSRDVILSKDALANEIATDNETNDDDLVKFFKQQDALRGTNFETSYHANLYNWPHVRDR